MNCRYRKTSLLPSGYTQLKWISPDGAAYINTELHGTQNIKIEETLQLNSIPSGAAAHTFGDFTANTQAITINLKASGASRFGSTSNTDVFGTIDLNKHTYGVSKNGFTIDGVVTKSLSNIADFTTTKTLLWMSSNYTSMLAIVSLDAKYHELKIWDNGVLVRDYIPAKNSSNEIGVYDLCGSICSLTNTPFYPNVGTGDFIAGPEEPRYSRIGGRYRRGLFVNGKFYKVPSDVTPMTFVKGNGSAYIKTPLTSYKNTYKYKLGIQRFSTSVKFVSLQNPSENEDTIGMFSDFVGYRFQNGRGTRKTITVSAGVFHDIVIESDGYSVDGTKTTITPVSEFTVNSSLYLFAGYNDTTVDTRISDDAVSYYYAEDSSGNLLMALIPAIKNSIVGVFDLVSQTFIAPHVGTLTAGTALTKDQIYQSVEKIERKVSILPNGYTPLQWVEADGTQCVRTGITPSNNMELNATITPTSSTIGSLMGSGTNDDDLIVFWSTRSSTVFRYICGHYPNKSKDISIANFINRKLIYKQIISPTAQSAYVDGELVGSSAYSANGNNVEMFFLCRKFNGIANSYFYGRVHEASLKKDGVEVVHYIPAKNQSNVAGFYDLVTNTFIAPTNGTLIAGPELDIYKEIPLGFTRSVSGASPLTVPDARALPLSKLELQGNAKRGIKIDGVIYPIPDGITPLEYVVFDGSTYIETGIIPGGKKIGAIVDFQFTDISRSTGGMVGSNKTDGTDNCQFTVYGSKWRVKINNYATYGALYDTNRHTLRLNMPNGTGLDDTVYTATQYTVASSNTNEMHLGACNYGSGTTLTYSLIGKLYSALFYDDTTLIRAYIPAIQNNIVGYYDFVTQQFIAPTGGTLTAGPEAPNPDCPLEILGVGDKTENLFDKTKAVHGDIMAANGEINPLMYRFVSDFIKVDDGDLFQCVGTMSKVGTSTRRNASFIRALYDENKNYITGSRALQNSFPYTIPSGAKYIRWEGLDINGGIGTSDTVDIDTLEITIIKGFTAPASYIPYGYRVPILQANNCGMVDMGTLTFNLYNAEKSIFRIGGITDMTVGSNTAYLNGYTQVTSGLTTMADMSFRVYASANALYIRNTNYTDATAFKNAMTGVPIYYQRTEDTSWTPPTTSVIYTDKPLFKSGNYTDLLEAVSGAQTNKWGVKVLDGTEGWTYTNNAIYEGIMYPNIPLVGVCSHFKYSTASVIAEMNDGEFIYNKSGGVTNGNLSLKSSLFTDLSTATAFLAAQYAAGAPVIVIYPLATATTSQETPTPVTLTKGTNYIASTNEVPASNIEVGYFKKTP